MGTQFTRVLTYPLEIAPDLARYKNTDWEMWVQSAAANSGDGSHRLGHGEGSDEKIITSEMASRRIWSKDPPPDASNPTGILLEKEVMGEEVNIRDFSGNRTLVRFDTGNSVTVQAGENGIRFLLISGKPIEEPVAWHGPIVMNTQEELMQAFKELRNGTFIRPTH